MKTGYLALMLHAHLPFVRHPEQDSYLEEQWLFEAITETYIPLINLFEGLEKDGIDFKLNMSVTPPLLTMLADPLLAERYLRYLNHLISLAEAEEKRTVRMPELYSTVLMYLEHFLQCKRFFDEKCKRDLISSFKYFSDKGNLEILTCCATHGYLPLMSLNPQAVSVQVEMGCRTHERFLGKRPAGIWLPECGYEPGIEEELAKSGLHYFMVDTHGLLNARPRPRNGVFAPVQSKSGLFAFGRDTESSKQVWSNKVGYPSSPVYRDFYRDIGFDLDYDYIDTYFPLRGVKQMTGMKYYKITGDTELKEVYNRDAALEQVSCDTDDFLNKRKLQIETVSSLMSHEPVIVAPYDAELFGHWWFEGPEWLNMLLRKMATGEYGIQSTTLKEYLERYPDHQKCEPSKSSWGFKGYSEYWLNESNDWVYPHLHDMADKMVELARGNYEKTPLLKRALNQAARELLLAQSSDWAFIMRAGTMKEYAEKRTKDHIHRFEGLYKGIISADVDEEWLEELERRDAIFPDMDYKLYR